ncbi:MAG: DEAD/DEAH box helicase [Thermofilaceae archaeon]|nr:DEAD/DEAH box helicase [Thermofilaceae archaeon]MCX8180376.1 DEAD/DEAH box helicase [Thermofilaceae archaeon]
MVIDSREILETLNYSYFYKEEDGSEPTRSDVLFSELLPQFSTTHLGREKLYLHQLEALDELEKGRNLVLIAGTGSGKTETWFLYAARKRVNTLVLYPTLALANDQVQRLSLYCAQVNAEMVQVDSPTLQAASNVGRRALREKIQNALVVASNPAFLLQDLKRYASSPSKGFLVSILQKFNLLVLDELDFYSPRELAIIVGMLRLFAEMDWKPQVAILTATLGNPEELAEILNEVNGRETAIVRGKPFKVSNRVYVILGKDLEKIRNAILDRIGDIGKVEVGDDVKRALTDPEEFRKNAYRVLLALRSLGVEVETPQPDLTELLSHYTYDDGVTLVFTRGIASAEELARRLRQKLGPGSSAVSAHHHLVSKEERRRIEEMARQGLVKIIVTPRTLVQGIDIGSIVRVVHAGLPEDVREFWQREGRKGRRRTIPFSETIIVPYSRWDRELLSKGFNALDRWLNLPLEKTLVNKDNKYSYLFTGLFKLVSTRSLGLRLKEEELRLLQDLGLVERGEVTARGKRTWHRLNFYEFGPPYGVKRVKITENGLEYLQEASHVDVVEKLQPGCFDYTSDFVVTNLKVTKSRWVTLVEEERPTFQTVYKHEFLAQAFEEYKKVKAQWGEKADLWSDYVRGLLTSEVICTMHPPTRGFGLYLEVPYRVVWIVEGEKVRSKVVGDKTYVYRPIRAVDVPSTTMGRYEDYGYGRLYELDPSVNLELARLGLALIKVVLRRVFSIGLNRVSYSLSSVGGRKTFVLFEDDSAGLIEKLNWLEVRRAVEKYEPDELDEALIQLVDDFAYMKLIEIGFRWDLARAHAVAVLDTVLASEKIRITVGGKEVLAPKPSKALKLLALDVLLIPLTEDEEVSLVYLATFDGERVQSHKFLKEFYLVDRGSSVAVQTIADYLNQGFSVVLYDASRVFRDLGATGLAGLRALLKGLSDEGKLNDANELLYLKLGARIGADELATYLGFNTRYTLDDVRREYEESMKRIRNLPYSKWFAFTQFLSKKAEAYLSDRVRNIYLCYLTLSHLEGEPTV